MQKVINFLVGLLTGAVVGATVALLLAPDAGSELQKQMRARVEGLIEEGRRAADARQAELEAQLEAFKRGAPVTIETTSEQPRS